MNLDPSSLSVSTIKKTNKNTISTPRDSLESSEAVEQTDLDIFHVEEVLSSLQALTAHCGDSDGE